MAVRNTKLGAEVRRQPTPSAPASHALDRRSEQRSLKGPNDPLQVDDVALVLASQGLSARFLLPQTTPLLGVLAAAPCIALAGKTLGLGLVPGFLVPLGAAVAYALYKSRRSLVSELVYQGLDAELAQRLLYALKPPLIRAAKQRAGFSVRAMLWPTREDKSRLHTALAQLLRESSDAATLGVEER